MAFRRGLIGLLGLTARVMMDGPVMPRDRDAKRFHIKPGDVITVAQSLF